jgi:hypothetical protein
VSLTQVSARFFLELALGIHLSLACTDRRVIGAGFTKLMAVFSLVALVPAILLARAGGGSLPPLAAGLGLGFGALLLVLLVAAGRSAAFERLVVLAAVGAGAGSLLAAVNAGLSGAPLPPALQLASSAGSMAVLGLVTGAMILGHWYLVTPDLPVAHLGSLTRLALIASYAKVLLLGATIAGAPAIFAPSARAFGGAFGIGGGSSASFQSELDFLWLLARVAIGLLGPIVLCHMTLATVKLKATQPATGILYAATVTVLMGELFAFVGERSYGVVL